MTKKLISALLIVNVIVSAVSPLFGAGTKAKIKVFRDSDGQLHPVSQASSVDWTAGSATREVISTQLQPPAAPTPVAADQSQPVASPVSPSVPAGEYREQVILTSEDLPPVHTTVIIPPSTTKAGITGGETIITAEDLTRLASRIETKNGWYVFTTAHPFTATANLEVRTYAKKPRTFKRDEVVKKGTKVQLKLRPYAVVFRLSGAADLKPVAKGQPRQENGWLVFRTAQPLLVTNNFAKVEEHKKGKVKAFKQGEVIPAGILVRCQIRPIVADAGDLSQICTTSKVLIAAADYLDDAGQPIEAIVADILVGEAALNPTYALTTTREFVVNFRTRVQTVVKKTTTIGRGKKAKKMTTSSVYTYREGEVVPVGTPIAITFLPLKKIAMIVGTPDPVGPEARPASVATSGSQQQTRSLAAPTTQVAQHPVFTHLGQPAATRVATASLPTTPSAPIESDRPMAAVASQPRGYALTRTFDASGQTTASSTHRSGGGVRYIYQTPTPGSVHALANHGEVTALAASAWSEFRLFAADELAISGDLLASVSGDYQPTATIGPDEVYWVADAGEINGRTNWYVTDNFSELARASIPSFTPIPREGGGLTVYLGTPDFMVGDGGNVYGVHARPEVEITVTEDGRQILQASDGQPVGECTFWLASQLHRREVPVGDFYADPDILETEASSLKARSSFDIKLNINKYR